MRPDGKEKTPTLTIEILSDADFASLKVLLGPRCDFFCISRCGLECKRTIQPGPSEARRNYLFVPNSQDAISGDADAKGEGF